MTYNNLRSREYQLEMLERIERAWRRMRSVMVQMPTGTGKTHVMVKMLAAHLQKEGGNVLVVAHRMELIDQISQTLHAFGIMHGTIVSGKGFEGQKNVQVASIQTLSKRLKEAFSWMPSLIIIDEAHHALAKTYRMLWERWPKAHFLGLTATPCRMSGEGFTDLFDGLLQSWSIQAFIDKGYLSDFEYVSASPESVSLKAIHALQKRGADGDYQLKEMATVLDVPESVRHLYDTYQAFAKGKKGIVYAINRQHAEHIAECYQKHGVRCAVIDAKTPTEERRQIVEGYKASGRLGIDVLVNVDIFSEGFDCPEVEFIQLARPTLSLSKYLQQVGRGMRVSKGKPHVLILDNVGLYQTFGLPTEERDWQRTFNGRATGRGQKDTARYVVLDHEHQEPELLNLEMVRIKKSGKRGAGLEIYLKDGRYGVMMGGRVTCPARFKKIIRLEDQSGFFAAGVYSGMLSGSPVDYSSLIDKRGMDMNLKLFRDVRWVDSYFFSSYQNGKGLYTIYWDPKGKCYYQDNPSFNKVAGVEVAIANEHYSDVSLCYKLRWCTGSVSPRFDMWELFYNRHIIIARDYLIVKRDRNHAYRIRGYQEDSIIVQDDDNNSYLQIFMDGRKGSSYGRQLPLCSKTFNPRRMGLSKFRV